MTAPVIKPCPFCGKTPDAPIDATRILGVWRLIHNGCTILRHFSVDRATAAEAIDAWNRRPGEDTARQEGRAEGLREAAEAVATLEGRDVDRSKLIDAGEGYDEAIDDATAAIRALAQKGGE